MASNADQYYIKSAENFRTYAFKLAGGRRVRFELSAADTERDNNKAAADKERRFILFADEPLAMDGSELVIRFEYRADAAKQKDLNAQVVAVLLALPGDAPAAVQVTDWLSWRDALAAMQPTESNPSRTALERHLTDYTAKNSFDYFIHKDLGRFLRRELDFFIKNEVMFLDDIEDDSAPRVEQYLAKIKALRQIAHQIIDFLAQLEDFQKKLWLKKKLVLETNWLVTLDKVPVELYPMIIANDAQRDEWVRLFAIDGINSDLAGAVAYSEPLTDAFLKANPFLVLDTALFDLTFKDALLASFDDIDSSTTGVLVHGDNFHALSLLKATYKNKIKCVYIDPPYNTGNDGFIYKDNYRHSTWLSFVSVLIYATKEMLTVDGVLFSSIDDNESDRLRTIIGEAFGDHNFIADIIWQKRYAPDVRTTISDAHEYIQCFAKEESVFRNVRRKLPLTEAQTKQFSNPDNDPRGPWKADNFTAQGFRSNQMYEITIPSGRKVTPPPGRCWVVTKDRFDSLTSDRRMYFGRDGNGQPAVKRFLKEMDGIAPWTWWPCGEVGHSQDGMKESVEYFGPGNAFVTAKPVKLIERILRIASRDDDIVLDFFGGSGTTANAAINLNKEEGASRKYILVEVGSHFDGILKERVSKRHYASQWRDGRPCERSGTSGLVRYIRLESYEDALDNLTLSRSTSQNALLERSDAKEFREDYLLHYMLDLESRGSLLDLARFEDPFNVTMTVTRDNETKPVTVDLVETFNYLLGLRVKTSERVRGILEVTGTTTDGERVLVLWRNVHSTDNDALDQWFDKRGYRSRDLEFDIIYVNGDNNIPNLRRTDETWKVRLIEEAFHELMFDVRDV